MQATIWRCLDAVLSSVFSQVRPRYSFGCVLGIFTPLSKWGRLVVLAWTSQHAPYVSSELSLALLLSFCFDRKKLLLNNGLAEFLFSMLLVRRWESPWWLAAKKISGGFSAYLMLLVCDWMYCMISSLSCGWNHLMVLSCLNQVICFLA